MTSVQLVGSTLTKRLEFVKKFHTNGRGLWSDKVATVITTHMTLQAWEIDWNSRNKGKYYGELRLYFDTSNWNINKDGLIYTDERFLREFKRALKARGLPERGVDYSEQGMQGKNYVSFDVGDTFVKSYSRKQR